MDENFTLLDIDGPIPAYDEHGEALSEPEAVEALYGPFAQRRLLQLFECCQPGLGRRTGEQQPQVRIPSCVKQRNLCCPAPFTPAV